MDEMQFKERVERIQEINNVVSKLDAAIRGEAFNMLKGYVTGEDDATSPPKGGKGHATGAIDGKRATKTPTKKPATPKGPVVAEPVDGEDELLEKHLSDADHENAMLAVAILYARHGRGPFKLAHITGVARQYNLNVPARLDMFFKSAKRGEAKALVIRKLADGWKIMPAGEAWLKETYGVKMGRSPLPS
ncbi:MAG: hypothetical protein M3340_05505 [Actinomycetota bacterium]|nr:hypothetical protein [Actinomycetota bacterium]